MYLESFTKGEMSSLVLKAVETLVLEADSLSIYLSKGMIPFTYVYNALNYKGGLCYFENDMSFVEWLCGESKSIP